ncbi:MAG TPA: heavy-metal-associated domain-containing protein [Candidatus Ventricola intestinavium]|nr:heavy-metal-associated domain-containing protein [Candidatus Ventricola intestinavium]
MANTIIVVVLVAVLVIGVKSYARKLAHGCCGSGDDAPKKVRVADKNPAHYPYCVRVSIEGMTCSRCRQRVEDALNRIEGVFAQVSLRESSATVRMKRPVSADEMRRVIAQAGYQAVKIENASP